MTAADLALIGWERQIRALTKKLLLFQQTFGNREPPRLIWSQREICVWLRRPGLGKPFGFRTFRKAGKQPAYVLRLWFLVVTLIT